MILRLFSVSAIVTLALCATEDRALLDRAQVLDALKRGLGTIPADIEIVEVSNFPAPEGEIVFEWSGLTRASSPMAATRWSGFVRRPDGQKFSIWAIVRLEADIVQIVAMESLKVGEAIREEQIREDSYRGFPLKEHILRADQVVGRAPIRPVREGAVIRPENLVAPPSIRRGGSAVADYQNAGVHLRLPVIVEQDGHVGERVRVRSVSTQKVMYGLIRGDGTIAVSNLAGGQNAGERKSSK